MSDGAYRLGYRIETNVRDLTPEEAALVAERVRDWDVRARRQAMVRVRELLFALPVAALFVIVAAGRGWNGVVFAAGLMFCLFAMLLYVARRQALALIATSRGPWHAPEGGWKVRDTRVVARSLTTVVTQAEDHSRWMLYEIPNGEWFYVDAICLLAKESDLARTDVRFTRLWPHGAYLEVIASGDPIPSRELADVWRPRDEVEADGTVAEATLPPAILNTPEPKP